MTECGCGNKCAVCLTNWQVIASVMRDRRKRSLAAAVLGSLLNACSAMVARPALRLGGEWAGLHVAFSEGAVESSVTRSLISEAWEKSKEGSGSVLSRRTIVLEEDEGTTISQTVLPRACSDANVLQPGNAMFEPDILNARAWALDLVDEAAGTWTCETVFDGLGGPRPGERRDSLECPAERTRVRCVFDPTTGALTPSKNVAIWQERCWSASPASPDLEERAHESGGLDTDWVSSVIGYTDFGGIHELPYAAKGDESNELTLALDLGGGVEIRGKPGMLEVTLRSGKDSRQQWSRVICRRSWIGGPDGMSTFAEVEAFERCSC